jgi:hypothetical protein
VVAQESCNHNSICDLGSPKTVDNIWPNSTSPHLCHPAPGKCEVCSGCWGNYPKCVCCNPLLSDPSACLSCRADPANAADCGSPVVSYNCGTDAQGRKYCDIDSGTGGAYATKADCAAKCTHEYYNCVNNQCAKTAPGQTGKYPSKAACDAECKPAPAPTPLSKCGAISEGDCSAWTDIFDAFNGTNWGACNNTRLDPCSCKGVCAGGCVSCSHGSITVMNIPPDNDFRGVTGTIPPSVGQLNGLEVLLLDITGGLRDRFQPRWDC